MLRSSLPRASRFGIVASTALAACLSATPTFAQGAAETFHQAYFVENEEGDLEAALELYRKAAKEARQSPELLQRIEKRMRACAEELATSDLASLMPGNSILYVELNDPGAQLSSLLDQLGLLQGSDRAGGLAISPHLIEGALGLRGAAVAITEIDPRSEMPKGVAILNPGDMQTVRGLIETALPAGGQRSDPIHGHPTYSLEGMLHVTMGERLIVAGTDRGLIEDVLRRVSGERSDSLTENPALQNAMAQRGDDLLYFCVNPEPVMPLVQGMLQDVTRRDPQAAMAISLIDVKSLRTISGRLGVQENGISMDAGLELTEGHHNMVFNLLRMPHVTASTFELVPSGSAAFWATSLNERSEGAAGITDAKGQPVVSFMDLGREVFGNLVDVAFFALPSTYEGPGGMPVPDAALAMSVNDVTRSKALWDLGLGLAQGVTGSGERQPDTARIDGTDVSRYSIEGLSVYLYAKGGRIVISPSPRAIGAAIRASSGPNVTQDPMFTELIADAGSDHTSVLGVSLGRIADVAAQVIPPREMREAGPFLELLKDSTVVATTRHSGTELRWAASVNGLPQVGPLVERFVRAEMGQSDGPREVQVRTALSEPASNQAASIATPANVERLIAQFEKLNSKGHAKSAARLIPAIAGALEHNPMDVNDFVWSTISGEGGGQHAQALLPAIERAVASTGSTNWYILDTCAHVHFALGHLERAVQIEQQAVEAGTASEDPRVSEAKAALARFQKGASLR